MGSKCPAIQHAVFILMETTWSVNSTKYQIIQKAFMVLLWGEYSFTIGVFPKLLGFTPIQIMKPCSRNRIHVGSPAHFCRLFLPDLQAHDWQRPFPPRLRIHDFSSTWLKKITSFFGSISVAMLGHYVTHTTGTPDIVSGTVLPVSDLTAAREAGRGQKNSVVFTFLSRTTSTVLGQ